MDVLNINIGAPDSSKLDLKKLLELSTAMHREIQALRGKEVTLVVGKTGSGKSTLINYLLKNKLVKTNDEDDTGDVIIQLDRTTLTEDVGTTRNSKQYAGIGHEFVSETVYPKGFETENGLLLCDTAGFGDNRSSENNAAAYLAVQMIIQSAALIKGIIVVLSADDFKNRAEALKETLSLLKQLIMDNANCMENFKNSVVFVFTHADTGGTVKTDKQILNLLGKAQRGLMQLIGGNLKNRQDSADAARNEVKSGKQIQSILKDTQHGLEKQISGDPNNEVLTDSLALCNIMLSSGIKVVVFDPLFEENGGQFKDKPFGRDCILNFIKQSGGIAKEDIAFRVERIFQQYSDTVCQIANSFLLSHNTIMNLQQYIDKYEQEIENTKGEISKLVKANSELEIVVQENVHLKSLRDDLRKLEDKIERFQRQIDENNVKRKSVSNDKYKLENDTTYVLVHTADVYSENAVYGVVQKGVIHRKYFDYSQAYPIAKIDYVGGSYNSTEGSSQKFLAPSYNEDRTRCKIEYVGPSHEYGRAEFRIYSEKRFTPDAKCQIKRYENDLKDMEKKGKELESDLEKAKEEKRCLSQTIFDAEKQNARDTKSLIESNKKRIEGYEKNLNETYEKLRILNEELESKRHTLMAEESLYQMIIQFNEIVPFEEQTVQEFIHKYKCENATPNAARATSNALRMQLPNGTPNAPSKH